MVNMWVYSGGLSILHMCIQKMLVLTAVYLATHAVLDTYTSSVSDMLGFGRLERNKKEEKLENTL